MSFSGRRKLSACSLRLAVSLSRAQALARDNRGRVVAVKISRLIQRELGAARAEIAIGTGTESLVQFGARINARACFASVLITDIGAGSLRAAAVT